MQYITNNANTGQFSYYSVLWEILEVWVMMSLPFFLPPFHPPIYFFSAKILGIRIQPLHFFEGVSLQEILPEKVLLLLILLC